MLLRSVDYASLLCSLYQCLSENTMSLLCARCRLFDHLSSAPSIAPTHLASGSDIHFPREPYATRLVQCWHRAQRQYSLPFLLLSFRIDERILTGSRQCRAHAQSKHRNPCIGDCCRSHCQASGEHVGENIRLEDEEVHIEGGLGQKVELKGGDEVGSQQCGQGCGLGILSVSSMLASRLTLRGARLGCEAKGANLISRLSDP